MGNKIKVNLKVEGHYEKDGLFLALEEGTELADFLRQVAGQKPGLKQLLVNQNTGELGIYMVIINGQMCRLASNQGRLLNDGDEIWIISPIGGG